MDKRQMTNSSFAVVLGTNEVASAVGIRLTHAGYRVILIHDVDDPVIRRQMAFYDVLYGDTVVLSGIRGFFGETRDEILRILSKPDTLAVTDMDAMELCSLGLLQVLVDTRIRRRRNVEDLRWLGLPSVGVGEGFAAGVNCDWAVCSDDPTLAATMARPGAGAGARMPEHFVVTRFGGLWHTAVEIGTKVRRGRPIGNIDGLTVYAPTSGTVVGMARDGIAMPADAKLVALAPSNMGQNASWSNAPWPNAPWSEIDRTAHIGRAVVAELAAGLRSARL